MSLVRLLTAGKSLIGLEQAESRYRMRGKHLLPKFGSDKNPFAKLSGSAPEEVVAESVTPGSPRVMSPEEIEAANLKETRRLPTVSAAPALETNPAPPRLSAAKMMLSRVGAETVRLMRKVAPMGRTILAWGAGFLKRASGAVVRKANPFALLPQKQSGPKKPLAAAVSGPVQGELSLDNVKVVRNDLSDADVEVVAARPSAKAKSAPPAVPAAAEEIELIKT